MKEFRYNEYMLFRLPKAKPLGSTALVRDDTDELEWKTLEELALELDDYDPGDLAQEFIDS